MWRCGEREVGRRQIYSEREMGKGEEREIRACPKPCTLNPEPEAECRV